MIMFAETDSSIAEGNPAYFRVDCFVSFIPSLIDGSRQPYYMSCVNCKKKVTEAAQGFECLKCDAMFDEALPAWNLSAKINDHSLDSTYLSLLGTSASPIMNMEASQYHEMMVSDAPNRTQQIEKML